jgi:hypothetical protein
VLSSEPSSDDISIAATVEVYIREGRSVPEIMGDVTSLRCAKNLPPNETLAEVVEGYLKAGKITDYYKLLEPYIKDEEDENFLISLIER